MTDCPTPSRTDYATEGAAWGALRIHQRTDGRTTLPYRCCCSAWHLAPAGEARAKRAAGRA